MTIEIAKPEILIVGHGVVGSALSSFYVDKANIYVKDLYKSLVLVSIEGDGKLEVLASSVNIDDSFFDISFVCVPYLGNGDYEVFSRIILEESKRSRFVVIKTTIDLKIVDFIERNNLDNVFYVPEFLRDATAKNDYRDTELFYIGGINSNGENGQAFGNLFRGFHSGVSLYNVSLRQALLIKLFRNVFLASKVALFNQFKEITDRVCGDNGSWEIVRSGVSSDKRIGTSHTMAPGVDGKYGYGGKCFPKDMDLLLALMDGISLDNSVFENIKEYNEELRRSGDR